MQDETVISLQYNAYLTKNRLGQATEVQFMLLCFFVRIFK